MDIDNDHSEEPAEWITAEKLEEIFPDMEYMLRFQQTSSASKGRGSRPDRDITSIFLLQRFTCRSVRKSEEGVAEGVSLL